MDALVKKVAARYCASSEKQAVIRKEKGEFCVRSPENPSWNGGCFSSKEKAEKRLQQVEFFKQKKGKRASLGVVTYDADHVPAIVVPKGGSSCATCKALSKDGRHCESPHFKLWRESLGGVEDPMLLPAPADSFCSDWYTPVDD